MCVTMEGGVLRGLIAVCAHLVSKESSVRRLLKMSLVSYSYTMDTTHWPLKRIVTTILTSCGGLC